VSPRGAGTPSDESSGLAWPRQPRQGFAELGGACIPERRVARTPIDRVGRMGPIDSLGRQTSGGGAAGSRAQYPSAGVGQ